MVVSTLVIFSKRVLADRLPITYCSSCQTQVMKRRKHDALTVRRQQLRRLQ